MAIAQTQVLDMAKLLLHAYEIGDMINASAESADYLYWKQQMEQDEEARIRVRRFEQKKELFADCERFGHFHPDYHAALEQVSQAQQQLDEMECVRRFKQAEQSLDELLHEVAETIARSVSSTIKVPSNNPLPAQGGGCASGSCSGSCGCG